MKQTIITLLTVLSFLNTTKAQNILDAAREGDITLGQEIINKDKESVNFKGKSGYTPLILASYYNQQEFVDLLIYNKVELNNQQNSSTALQAAAYKGFDDIVEKLLEYGANPNIWDNNGTTPLIYAVQFNHLNIVNLLIKYGSDVDYKDSNGSTALDYARQLKLSSIIALLEQ